jgi:hypothetical protein
MKTVWAYMPLPELNDQTGFVQCDAKLADQLLEQDLVQDPHIGANNFKYIQPNSGEYLTRDMAAVKKTVKPKAKKGEGDA